ncbi:MAG: hypothetical protein IT372_31845 [Polyangiaceae bacterium]|nr:hypothetical protein [Polyangiaceae bacterium]
MRRRLLTLAARHPLIALALVLALGLAGASALVSGALRLFASAAEEPFDARGSGSPSAPFAPNPSANPRLILGRVWFDRYPEKRNEDVKIWIFLGGGVGLFESGSAYRSSFDVFDFERQGDKVSMTFLHDRKTAETKFTVRACDDRPPFDLCLDLQDSPRGPRTYYGFGSDDEMARRIPWGQAMMKSAEGRAGAR